MVALLALVVTVSHIIMQNPTDQAETPIPTETTASEASNLNRTVTVRRKATKCSERWYQNIAAPLLPSLQGEDIPARKKRRVESLFPQQQTKLLERLLHLTFR
jgi:hypothetical protein